MKSIKITAFCLISLLFNPVSGQSVSEKRTFSKTLPVSEGCRMEILNKYGDIHITTWDKNEAYVSAEVEAFAPNHSKLEKMFDGININISASASTIRAETEFAQSITVLLESIKGLTDKLIDYGSKVQINYYINLPDNIDINIENQFGDISMENNSGTLSVNLSNGNFKANSVNKISGFRISLGEAEIGSVKSCKINSFSSSMVISQAGELDINSTSSKFDLKKAGKISVDSRRDKFFTGELSEIDGTSYFTDYKINSLGKNINLTTKYGSLSLDNIKKDFDEIDLSSSYSDVTLAFDPTAEYSFEIRHTNAFLVISDKDIQSEKQVLNEERKEYITSGKHGNNPGLCKVRIDATRGNICLK